MDRIRYASACAVCAALLILLGLTRGLRAAGMPMRKTGATEIVRYEDESSSARVEPARWNGRPGLAVVFEGTGDMHYYARSETAPAPGLQLKIEAASDAVQFGRAIFPPWEMFTDSVGQNVEVYVGDFTVFVPFRNPQAAPAKAANVTVQIAGIACTSKVCLRPFEKTLTTTVDLNEVDTWASLPLAAFAGALPGQTEPDISASDPGPPAASQAVPPAQAKPDISGSQAADSLGASPSAVAPAERQTVLPYGTGVYYLLAIAAGLSINIMPCVLPILPLILMRLVGGSNASARSRLASGLAFCGGIILFFGAFALVSAIVNFTTGAVLDLNSLFRYPAAVIVLFLAIVFFGLAMLDVVTLSLPPSVAGRQIGGSGLAGSIGMGFFAGVLSTPCSGALLGFTLVWAQTQPLLVSSAAIVLMGVGMALPYGVIASTPALLNRLPRPGYWMEVFKKSTGFLLFFIAVKLTLAALPKDRLLNVLTYGIIFSFCAWMWSKWVGLSTPALRRRTIRLLAVALAVVAGWWLLPAPARPGEAALDWRPYDAELVQQAVAGERPVLLKFTADWCTNCKVVERRAYRDPEVVRLMETKDVLPIKADTTLNDYPATRDLREVYGEAGNVPVSIILLPDGSRQKLRGIFDKAELIRILSELPEGKS